MALVNLADPIAFCLLPEVGLGFLAPPRRTRTLTMTTPGFALYPRRRAVTSRVGRVIFFTTGSLLQPIAALLSQSRKSGVPSRHHAPMSQQAIGSLRTSRDRNTTH